MSKTTTETRIEATPETMGALEIIVREGARKMLQAALEAEIEEHLLRFKHLVDEAGKRLVVRNGIMPERTILTGAGPIPITRPRVEIGHWTPWGRNGSRAGYSLPSCAGRRASIPLCLCCISRASRPTLPDGPGGNPWPPGEGTFGSPVVRLKEIWTEEYAGWSKRDLSGKRYVYVWADGVYCNARLEDERSCLLVVMGADSFGNKELLAV